MAPADQQEVEPRTTALERTPLPVRHAVHAVLFTAACVLGVSVHLLEGRGSLDSAGGAGWPVWPATGLAVLWAALEGRVRRRLATLGAAAALAGAVGALSGAGVGLTLATALPPVLTAAVVLAVTERLQRSRLRLSSTRDLWALVAGTVAGGAAGALAGAVLVAGGTPDLTSVAGWLGRAVASVLLVTALGLLLRRHQQVTSRTAGALEQAAVWVCGVASFAVVFVLLGVPVAFVVLPAAVWAAQRLPTRSVALHLAGCSVVVLAGTLAGRGPFSGVQPQGAVDLAHLFVAVLACVVLSISLHRDELAELATRLDSALAASAATSELLEAVHASVSDGIVVYSADGTCLLRNPAADRLLGPSPRHDTPVVRALAGEAVVGVDLVVRSGHTPDGVTLSCDAHPLPDVPGAPWSHGAVAVFHDVSQARAEAAEAARTRDLLAGVLDGATQQGVFATGADHRITVFSSGAERLTGWSAAEAVGDTPGRFLRLADVFERAAELGVPPGPEVMLHGLREHGHTTRRWTFVRHDGTTFAAELTLSQVLDDDGDPVGAVAVFTDVTAQIAAEQRLADSEEQFRLAFETAPTGMVVLDLAPGEEGRITRANAAFAAFTGRSRAELVTLRARDVLHPDEVPGHLERLGRLVEGHRVTGGHGGFVEQRFTTPDGAVRWARTDASVIQRSDGGTPHLLVVVEDVTERHATQEALQRAALHDALTGLPNRTLLGDRLQQALAADVRECAGVTVLFIDLDGFKPVNDEHGHAAGDDLLRAVADRLTAALRRADTVARVGGDEFAVVCPRLPAHAVPALVGRLDAAVSEPVALASGAVVQVGASIGHATAVGGDDDAHRLLEEADHRMYAAKRRRHAASRPVR